jgi:CBS domain-containing protein
MDTQISTLMTTPVITVRADDTVTAVAEVLARHGISFVPVTERAGGTALGIISSGDILHFRNCSDDTDEPKAWQICAYKPLTVPPEASIAHVARLMVEHQAHHVLVMRGPELVGVVSSLDFVKHYMTHAEDAARQAAGKD